MRGNLGVISRISSRCLGLEPPAGRGDAACLLMPGLAAAPQSYVEPPQTHTPGLAAALQSCVEPPKCTCPRQGWQQPHSPAQAPPNAHTSAGSSPAILPAPPQMHTPGLAAAPQSCQSPPKCTCQGCLCPHSWLTGWARRSIQLLSFGGLQLQRRCQVRSPLPSAFC